MNLNERYNVAKAKIDTVILRIEEFRQAISSREKKIKDINSMFDDLEDLSKYSDRLLKISETKKKLDEILNIEECIKPLKGAQKVKIAKEIENLAKKDKNFAKNAFLFFLLRKSLRNHVNLSFPHFSHEENRIEELLKVILDYKRMVK